MNKKVHFLWYIIADYLTASVSWIIFFIFRKISIEPLKFGYSIPLEFDNKFWLGLLIIPVFWIFLYYLSGYYSDIFRKSQIENIVFTFIQTLIGVLVIFFSLILDDYVSSYKIYYLLLAVLFFLHFINTLILRFILIARQKWLIRKNKAGYKTIIIGGNEVAVEIYKELMNNRISSGNFITGFISTRKQTEYPLSRYTIMAGSVDTLDKVMVSEKAEEVIIALEDNEYDILEMIFNKLALFQVYIKVTYGMQNVLSGKIKMEHLYGSSLIQISPNLMPPWQENIKKMIDIVFSAFALLILSPLLIFISTGIKISSPGPVIYSHERIGRFGKPFRFYKFRSMRNDAEISGPELSSKNDQRLTKFGRFLRKYRLDEIPNFYNVLKGDLSLVGPRPEREYFMRQILKKAPYYIQLQKVKPGITSWGQVKYGYAENVDQMIKRLDYDIMYIRDMSLYVDFKILFYTFMTIIKGRGI